MEGLFRMHNTFYSDKWIRFVFFYTPPLSSDFSCLQFRVFTAPFHRVEFADFWLADQLNSLVVVLMDLEYLICFYVFELQWSNSKGLLPKGDILIYDLVLNLIFSASLSAF